MQHDGVGPDARTITRYVNEYNNVGMPPIKTGFKSDIPRWAFVSVCTAFESYIAINQLNGASSLNTRNKLSTILNTIFDVAPSNHPNHWIIKRVTAATALNLKATKAESAEDRRKTWTTYKNLDMWFENWTKDLVQLGFATYVNPDDPNDSTIHITDEQMTRIINFDETCCSLDGGSGTRGGRPVATFYNPNLPQLGIGTSKTALTTTLITGSSAAGEAIPPHFQFSTTATADDMQKLRTEIAMYSPDILCKFGRVDAEYLGISYGMNEKGGMDEVEFEKYVMNSIVPLYPDSDDVPGKRVMIKVDSGPGRLNARLVARLRLLGFYLYPGVPNTTAVSQETDRNYGPFKGQYRNNLANMVDRRLKDGKSVSLQPCLVSIPVFGSVDPETNVKVGECAFTKGFSTKACLTAWEKVGAAFNNSYTRKCLDDPKVRISFGDGSDDYLNAIQMGNDLAVYALNEGGYDGDLLKGVIQETKAPEVLTRPQSMERVKLLAEASTHGAKLMPSSRRWNL